VRTLGAGGLRRCRHSASLATEIKSPEILSASILAEEGGWSRSTSPTTGGLMASRYTANYNVVGGLSARGSQRDLCNASGWGDWGGPRGLDRWRFANAVRGNHDRATKTRRGFPQLATDGAGCCGWAERPQPGRWANAGCRQTALKHGTPSSWRGGYGSTRRET